MEDILMNQYLSTAGNNFSFALSLFIVGLKKCSHLFWASLVTILDHTHNNLWSKMTSMLKIVIFYEQMWSQV